MEFQAKANCKSCRGSGFVTRSFPKNDGKKGMVTQKTLCHCATEIIKPEPEEAVVPKVSSDLKQYACKAVPDGEDASQ